MLYEHLAKNYQTLKNFQGIQYLINFNSITHIIKYKDPSFFFAVQPIRESQDTKEIQTCSCIRFRLQMGVYKVIKENRLSKGVGFSEALYFYKTFDLYCNCSNIIY
jgi:hypothetical protein